MSAETGRRTLRPSSAEVPGEGITVQPRARHPRAVPRLPLAPGWLRPVFPADRAERTPRPLLLLGAVLLLAVAVLRLGPRTALDTIWAEDGSIFLTQALHGGLHLTTPYAGYMHAVPRLLVQVPAVLPLGWAAPIITLEAALVAIGCAGLVFRATSGYLSNPWVRAGLAAYLAAAPISAEMFDALANLQWYLVVAALVLLLWDPPSRWWTGLSAVVVLLTATSHPFTFLFLPLAVARVWVLRSLRSAVVPLALVVGVAVQASVMVSAPARSFAATRPTAGTIAHWYVDRVLPPALTGQRMANLGLPWLGPVLLVLLILFLVLTWRPGSGGRTVVLLLHSVVLYAALTEISRDNTWRYSFSPGLILVVAVAVGVDGAVTRAALAGGRAVAARAMAALVIVALAAGCVASLRPVKLRRSVLWSVEYRRAERTCASRPDGEVSIQITPSMWLHWVVQAPCDRVRG